MKKIRILPVYPEFPITFWSFKKTLEILDKSAVMPPTGLATVLAMLPEEHFECHRIIDLNIEPLKDEYFEDCDMVFTSTMLIQQESHDEVIDRAHFFGKPVVAGGPFPTNYPEQNQKADYIVGGEAEVTLSVFIDDLLNGNPQSSYDEKEVIESGANRSQLTHTGKPVMTETPLPRWDLVRLDRYVSAAIQYSRGCPFDCEFCDITKLFGRESRTKTPDQMIRELEALYAQDHLGSVFIVDDNFIGNRKHVREFLPAVEAWQKEHNFPFELFTEASMNLAWPQNNDILTGMVDAGFNEVFVGIESVDEEVLSTMNKGQNTKQSTLESIKTLQGAGLSVTGGFIIGSDGEKPTVFENLYNFIQEAGVVIPMPGLLTALKNTNLWNRLEKEGRLYGQSTGNNTHNFGFNFKTELDEEFLIEGYRKLIQRLFNDKNYFERCRTLHKHLGKKVHRGRKIRWEEVKIFLRSVRSQIFKRGSFEYIKYLADIAINYPSHFTEAVGNAIKLEHLRSITHSSLAMDSFQSQLDSLYDNFKEYTQKIAHEYDEKIHHHIDSMREEAERIIKRAEAMYSKLNKDAKLEAQKAINFLKEKLHADIDNLLNRSLPSTA